MVDKITGPITPLGEINKINEIIDNLGGSITVDQTYNASSANAQSGVAINGAKFIQNTAKSSSALTVGGTASGYTGGTNVGVSSQAKQNYGTALGYNTNANGNSSTCIGRNAGTSAASAIQIGAGVNSTANTLQVGFIHASTNYQLLDGTTGKIPNDRIKYDGTTITVNSNGELTVDIDKIISWGIPDLTAGVSWYYNGTAVELPCDAFVTVDAAAGGARWVGVNLYVNGNLIMSNASIYNCSVSMVLPKGSRVSGDETYQHITYYPLKGVN